MGNRAKAEAVILTGIAALDPSGMNSEMYKTFFAKMSDTDFDNYYRAIKEGRDYISIVADNLNGSKVTTANNLAVAERWGYKFFQRVWVTDETTGKQYLSGPEYLVVDLPLRRQIQTLVNKMSVPEDNKHVDELTDQPTGVSKGSSLSFPELLVLYAQGYEQSITELIKFRGGDIKLMNQMDKQIHETGGVRMEGLGNGNTRVKSTQTLATLLRGAHLDNNF